MGYHTSHTKHPLTYYYSCTHFVDVVIITYYYLDCLSLILPTSACFTWQNLVLLYNNHICVAACSILPLPL
ncbi:uncharacterized protein BO66DRAFT_391601 [Aspergillus aculeatinus CBS 121060]|uniref:Uncharacterized protein n=1 Tax=Aspergillus aculeatinus CBS 121060 TaxID=1448322 RepID=A0ACD1HB05_9EURO|nr:hypothetical protein BO66DRAFT_391601 [Aspergillus aculeatinus CBS 121060]RAH70781.1 hypothetical protein BO66DRAFT_391601 [Aspergillus aculeatinus CBS 121060]